jgi:catechol 2,3-dioxygenase-like lactoylglutathione lyase family enzyme
VHVGSDTGYIALYTGVGPLADGGDSYRTNGALNHVGIVVDDLAAVERRVQAAGFTAHSHADYEPGQRFYFDGPDGVEFEVVCYDGPRQI